MTNNDLLDPINIKTLPELIINQLKNNNKDIKIKNLRAFYTYLFSYLNEDLKNSYLNRILKYLSYNEESEILLLEDIKNHIYKKEICEAFNSICNEIDKYDDNLLFYNQLKDSCKFIYFNNDEQKILQNEFNNHGTFLYYLFIHACSNYKTNTPNILAERLLHESYCLSDKNESKKVLLKASADLGNDLACLLYGNLVYSNYNERFKYFLKGKSTNECIWEMAFIVEHFEINEEQFKIVLKEYKDIIKEGEKFINNEIISLDGKTEFEKECTLTALKIYYYLSNIRNYSKGYCSVGKFFLIDKVAVIDKNKNINELASKEVAIEYTIKAIRLSNIPAIQNLATYYYKNKINDNINIKELLQIGANAMDMLSNIYLAKILLDENKIDEAEKYLAYISTGNNGEAQYQLAKIYENKGLINDSITYYEKAIENKHYEAVINLSKLYFKIYMNEITTNNNKNGYLLLAINLIEKYMNEYNTKQKEEAIFLLKNMKDISN